MKRPTPLLWISLGLAALTFSILLMSDLVVNLIPDQRLAVFAYRQKFSEALAVQYSLLAKDGDSGGIQEALDILVARNEDILSVALLLEDGTTLAVAGPHQNGWKMSYGDESTSDHIQVPIYNGNQLWATFQLRFHSLDEGSWTAFFRNSWVRFVGLVVVSSFWGYFWYMKRTLRQLDPTSVVPLRVKAAFDVLSEGVVLLDAENRIVLANRAFGQIVGIEAHEVVGEALEGFAWSSPDPLKPLRTYPWQTARTDKCLELDVPIVWKRSEGNHKKFSVNCTPILDERKCMRGVLVSFNDVTALDETIRALEASKAELEKMAFLDPLTGWFNRRAFFDAFEDQWEGIQREGTDLACIMADIDHFKSFNDRFGHTVGDQVIQAVAKILSTTIRPLDIMGRYGGEEFCIILPGHTCAEGAMVAERLRQQIEELANLTVRTTEGKKITMSFGVSAASLGGTDHLELVVQADKALYAAKEGGRNQVGHWTSEGPVTGQVQPAELVGRHFS